MGSRVHTASGEGGARSRVGFGDRRTAFNIRRAITWLVAGTMLILAKLEIAAGASAGFDIGLGLFEFRSMGFDLANDAVGAFCIAYALFLFDASQWGRQRSVRIARWLAVVHAAALLAFELPGHMPAGLELLVEVMAIVGVLLTISVFREFARWLGDSGLTHMWNWTFWLTAVALTGLFTGAQIVLNVAFSPFHLHTEGLIVLGLVLLGSVALVAAVLLFVSLTRTRGVVSDMLEDANPHSGRGPGRR